MDASKPISLCDIELRLAEIDMMEAQLEAERRGLELDRMLIEGHNLKSDEWVRLVEARKVARTNRCAIVATLRHKGEG